MTAASSRLWEFIGRADYGGVPCYRFWCRSSLQMAARPIYQYWPLLVQRERDVTE